MAFGICQQILNVHTSRGPSSISRPHNGFEDLTLHRHGLDLETIVRSGSCRNVNNNRWRKCKSYPTATRKEARTGGYVSDNPCDYQLHMTLRKVPDDKYQSFYDRAEELRWRHKSAISKADERRQGVSDNIEQRFPAKMRTRHPGF